MVYMSWYVWLALEKKQQPKNMAHSTFTVF